MLKNFPGRVELCMFIGLALVCASLVRVIGAPDTGLSLMSIPLFISCALLGMWKSGRFG